MKILKHGNLKPLKFTCWHCGCEFVADMSEYRTTMANGINLWHNAYCPECDAETTDSKVWEEQENE